MSEKELKACPMCGGDAEIVQHGTSLVSTVYACLDCGCRLETGETWQIPHAWNTRPAEDKLQSRIEELEEDMSRIDDICFTGLRSPEMRLRKIHEVLAKQALKEG